MKDTFENEKDRIKKIIKDLLKIVQELCIKGKNGFIDSELIQKIMILLRKLNGDDLVINHKRISFNYCSS